MLPNFRIRLTKSFFKRAGWIFIAVTFLVTGLGVGVIGFFQATNPKDNNSKTNQTPKLKGTTMPEFTPVGDVSELQATDKTVGDGQTAAENSNVIVQYIGALASNGIIFDTSLDTDQPAAFNLNEVIPGFRQGIIGMKVGGTRQILIPSDLGYGEQGTTGIPPNSDLVFTVSLLNVSN